MVPSSVWFGGFGRYVFTVPAVDFVVLGVLFLFSDISRWKLGKIGRYREQVQKGNTYNSGHGLTNVKTMLGVLTDTKLPPA